MNAELCWCAKMAQSAQAIAIDAGRSPSGELNAYVAAVPSRKKLGGQRSTRIEKGRRRDVQAEEDEDLGPDARVVLERVHAERLKAGKDDEDGRPACAGMSM
jgi:hypothetical protein